MEASSGFFGPSLVSDISLIVQILFYLALSAGVVAQLLKKYKLHDWLQAPVVVLNIFFIIFVMLPAFGFAAKELPMGIIKVPVLVTVIHSLLGLLAQLLAVYCLLAGFKVLPRKIGTLRYWMWATYAFWTATVIFGVGVYMVYYTGTSAAAPPDQPQQIVEEHDADLGQQVDPPAETEQEQQVDPQPAETEATQPPQEVVSEHAEAVVELEAPPTIEPEPEAAPAEPTPIPEPTQPPPAPEPIEEQPPVAEEESAPAGPQWLQLQAANAGPGPRYEFSMQFSPATNQVYLFGGRDGSQDYNDVWALNLADLSWRQLAVDSPTAPQQRHSANMIIDEPTSSLYIATGQGPGGVLNDVWRLDLNTETWEDLSATAGEAPAPRYGGPGGNIGGNLLATHGFGSTRYDDTWQFNVTSQQWENITPAYGEKPLNRCLFAAAPVDTNLVIHGGCASGFGPCPLEDTWVLDTAAQSWRQISSATQPSARQHQSLVNVTGLPQVVLFGGQNADNAPLSDLWLLNLATDTWQSLPSDGPSPRYNHAAVWIPGQGMLVYGGRSANALGDLWLLRLQPEGAAPPPPPPPPTEPPPTPEPPPEPTPTSELINPEPTDDTVSEHDGG